MERNTSLNLLFPIFGSLLGMGLGFLTFLFTGSIIFLIAFTTIGLTLGLALGQKAPQK